MKTTFVINYHFGAMDKTPCVARFQADNGCSIEQVASMFAAVTNSRFLVIDDIRPLNSILIFRKEGDRIMWLDGRGYLTTDKRNAVSCWEFQFQAIVKEELFWAGGIFSYEVLP